MSCVKCRAAAKQEEEAKRGMESTSTFYLLSFSTLILHVCVCVCTTTTTTTTHAMIGRAAEAHTLHVCMCVFTCVRQDALRKLTGPEMTAKAQAMGRTLRREKGVANAAEAFR